MFGLQRQLDEQTLALCSAQREIADLRDQVDVLQAGEEFSLCFLSRVPFHLTLFLACRAFDFSDNENLACELSTVVVGESKGQYGHSGTSTRRPGVQLSPKKGSRQTKRFAPRFNMYTQRN